MSNDYSSEGIDDLINEIADPNFEASPTNAASLFSSISNFLGGGGGQGLAGLGLLLNAYNRLGGIGERGLGLGQDLATTQLEQAAFRPYTVVLVPKLLRFDRRSHLHVV